MAIEVLLMALACAKTPDPKPAEPAAPLVVTSTTFADGAVMPDSTVYAGSDCHGGNKSPALAWTGVPDGARSLAVIGHDPDAPHAGGWTHWVLFDVPPTVSSLPEDAGNVSRAGMPDGAMHGSTDFGERAYGGPCPPPGSPHHYEFTVYALDVKTLGLGGTAKKPDVEQAMDGHILARGRITGLYGR